MALLSLRSTRLNSSALAAYHLLKRMGVTVSSDGMELAWERAGGNSLYSIGRQLRHWHVAALCLEVEADALTELPTPFIAHLPGTKSFLVVTAVEREHVHFIDDEGRESRMPIVRFLKAWAGHVLLAERSERSGSSPEQKKSGRRTALILPFIIAFFLALAAIALHQPGLIVLLFIKAAGIAVSALLLLAELDKHHPLATAFCKDGKGCNEVLKSARPIALLSWSEAGLIYFLTGFFLLLLHPASLLPLAVGDGLALLFPPYSMYVQGKSGSWCRLCLTVVILVLLQAATYLLLPRPLLFSIHWTFVPTVIGSILLFLLVRAAMTKTVEARRYRRGYHRMKYHPAVFAALLREQKSIHVPDDLGLVLGDANAPWQIVQVCHPFCRPCARTHELMEELQAMREDVCVRIVFNVADDGDVSALPVLHFLALRRCTSTILSQALADWYAGSYRSYESFTERYAAAHSDSDREELARMDAWCTAAGISFTPTLFVNGRQLPAQYDAADLHLLLDS